MSTHGSKKPAAMCPLRPGEPCTLCQISVTGPQDCGLVYLVMGDEELREGLRQQRLATAGKAGAAAGGSAGVAPAGKLA